MRDIRPDNGIVVWLCGRPASGKSTLARRVARRLSRPCVLLDGDEVRAAVVPAHGYSPEERDHFYTTLANLAKLISDQGFVVLVPATAHRRAYRAHARAQSRRFLEVYVATPSKECELRDPKGLYRAARLGAVPNLPGCSLEYEEPAAADVTANGGHDDAAVERIAALLED